MEVDYSLRLYALVDGAILHTYISPLTVFESLCPESCGGTGQLDCSVTRPLKKSTKNKKKINFCCRVSGTIFCKNCDYVM